MWAARSHIVGVLAEYTEYPPLVLDQVLIVCNRRAGVFRKAKGVWGEISRRDAKPAKAVRNDRKMVDRKIRAERRTCPHISVSNFSVNTFASFAPWRETLIRREAAGKRSCFSPTGPIDLAGDGRRIEALDNYAVRRYNQST
jgi:hypothetical protein